MANPVVVDFILRGMPDVSRAMRTVEQATTAAERSMSRQAAREAQARKRVADQEARDKVRAMQRADQEVRRIQDRAIREAQRSADASAKAAERAANAEIRAAERAARAKINSLRQAEREVERIGEKARQRVERDAQKQAAIAQSQQRAAATRFNYAVGGAAASGAARGVGKIAGLATATAGMVGQLGGGFGLADSVQRNAKNSGEVADLINAGVNQFSQIAGNRTRMSRGKIDSVLDQTTQQYGLERSAAIGGVRAFTKSTGDLETGLKVLPQLGELTRATGSDFEEMTAAAGKVGMSFDNIANSTEKAEKIMSVMRIIAGQGKAGSVEIGDMAVQLGKLVATANKFEGDNVENLAKMGMLSQFAAGGGGAWSAASAATAVTSFAGTFSKGSRQKAFAAEGIQLFADKGNTKLRAPEEIIADSFAKTKGDQGKLAGLFGSAMSMRAINKFADIYKGGYTDAKGNKLQGKEAILGYAKEMTQTTMTKTEVSDSAKFRMQEADAQMAQAREAFDNAVRSKIIPTLLKLIPEFERMIPILVQAAGTALPAFVDLLKTVGEFASANRELIQSIAAHPIGAILAKEVASSVATAGLGQVLAKVMSTSLGGAGGVTVAAATMAIALGVMKIDQMADETTKAQQASLGSSNQAITEAVGVSGAIRRGEKVDDKELARLASLRDQMQQRVASEEAHKYDKGALEKTFGWLGIKDERGEDYSKQYQASREAQLKQSQEALVELNKALSLSAQALKRHAETVGGAAATAGASGKVVGAPRVDPIVKRN